MVMEVVVAAAAVVVRGRQARGAKQVEGVKGANDVAKEGKGTAAAMGAKAKAAPTRRKQSTGCPQTWLPPR